MKEIQRTGYLERFNSWRDKGIIKVITGIRRSGKSTLMRQYQRMLLADGIKEEQIISLNFEDMSYSHLMTAQALHDYVTQHLVADKMNYIFLDEVQLVTEFERAVNSLYLRQNVDIYITGSNAHMLSGELATLLSGRYITIHILPLSFAEYSCLTDGYSLDVYKQYINSTSFPYGALIKDINQLTIYLNDIYNAIIMRDIVMHTKIDNISVLHRLSRFLADNIGNLTSSKRIADMLTSTGIKTNPHTIETYIQYLCNGYLYYPVHRYDIKGGELLRTGQKYYLADVGFQNILLDRRKADTGRILENVIYLELQRRGYQVHVGAISSGEVDFVCIKNRNIEYYQVAESVTNENTLKRELASLKSIHDHYPKFLLTLDNIPPIDHDGIHQLYAVDWLLGK